MKIATQWSSACVQTQIFTPLLSGTQDALFSVLLQMSAMARMMQLPSVKICEILYYL